MGIQIGDGNKIKNTIIAEKIEVSPTMKNKRFCDRHPWVFSFLISLLVGIFLMFSGWDNIITWIERCF